MSGAGLEECPDLEGIETSEMFPMKIKHGQACLEECPDLEGIETTK